MLQAKKNNRIYDKLEQTKDEDIIVQKVKTTTETDKDGNTIIKRKIKNINLTKLVNETKKIIKQTNAEEKLAELEKVFSK